MKRRQLERHLRFHIAKLLREGKGPQLLGFNSLRRSVAINVEVPQPCDR